MPRPIDSRYLLPEHYVALPEAPAPAPVDRDAFTVGVTRQQSVAHAAFYGGGHLRGPSPVLHEPRQRLDVVWLPLRRWRWGLACASVALMGGSLAALQSYVVPQIDSPRMMRRSLQLGFLAPFIELLQTALQQYWMAACRADLTNRVAQCLAGEAAIAEDVQASQITGTAVNQLENVMASQIFFLQTIPSQLSQFAVSVGIMLRQRRSLSPWLLGSAVATSVVTGAAACSVFPHLSAVAMKRDVANQEQLYDLAPLCGNGSSEEFASWQARRWRSLLGICRINLCANAVGTGIQLVNIAVLTAAYGAVGWLWGGAWSQVERSAIMATQTSVMQITAVLSTVPELIGVYMANRRQAATLRQSVEALLCDDLERHIRWDRIHVTCAGRPASVTELLAAIQSRRPGYWRITGANGAGKSTLLHLLKKYCGDDSKRLLTRPLQSQGGCSVSKESAGSIKWNLLADLLSGTNKAFVLLLDECRANLHPDKVRILAAQIEDVARRKLVVEVAHDPPQTAGRTVKRSWSFPN